MHLTIEGNTITFWLRVKPRSSRERIIMDSSGELRLEIHAAATEGRANDAMIGFLARALGIAKGSIAIVTGKQARRKLVRIQTAAPDAVASRLRTLAAGKGGGFG